MNVDSGARRRATAPVLSLRSRGQHTHPCDSRDAAARARTARGSPLSVLRDVVEGVGIGARALVSIGLVIDWSSDSSKSKIAKFSSTREDRLRKDDIAALDVPAKSHLRGESYRLFSRRSESRQ
jgi:hypothetical protein